MSVIVCNSKRYKVFHLSDKSKKEKRKKKNNKNFQTFHKIVLKNSNLWTDKRRKKSAMKMNFKYLLCAFIIIEIVQFIEAKRSFGLTSRRSKSKSPSVRRGHQGHDGDDHAPLPKPPAPAPAQKNIGWNTQQAHNTQGQQKNIGWNTQQAHNTHGVPMGPASLPNSHAPQGGVYGNSYGSAPSAYGAPPAYSSGFNQPKPGYGSAPPAYGAPPAYSHPSHGYGPQMNSAPFGGNMNYGQTPMMSSPMMGMPMMGVMPMQTQSRSSGFGSGLMTNLFAGLAGYQIAKAFSGGGYGSGYQHAPRERDVIIINNPPAQTATVDATAANQQILNTYPHTPLNPPPSGASIPPAAEPAAVPDESPDAPLNTPESVAEAEAVATLPQLVATNNEYNYWGLPQYGIPLYGYNLPSQITEYYQIDTIKLNHDSQSQQQQQLQQKDPEQTTTASESSS